MIEFFLQIKAKNEPLFYFGLICLILGIIFLTLTKFTNVLVNNTNAWYKPFKFAISIAAFSWTMAWYCAYLPHFNIKLFNWTVILLFGFEIFYIALQAGRGQLSHFNLSTPLTATLYSIMGLAATIVTLYTAYIGILFFTNQFPNLSNDYVWAIRLGIIIFVIFSFEGAIMGGRMSHTIGGEDGGTGIPILNWSTKFGDPRIAHFIGMHALQLLPLLSYYVLKNTKATFFVAFLYLLLASFILIQALKGKPLIRNSFQTNKANPQN